ncbi:MAG: hypothetical protein QOK71_07845 [Nitrososphaeraceae archaeon]|nr:hypothetical protein [Nitrososphaeraceae archaeon]
MTYVFKKGRNKNIVIYDDLVLKKKSMWGVFQEKRALTTSDQN